MTLNQRWIQDKVTSGEIKLVKCKGVQKPAAILTKHLDANGIRNRMAMFSAEYADMRPAIAPEI